jgi:hypothetical protein
MAILIKYNNYFQLHAIDPTYWITLDYEYLE